MLVVAIGGVVCGGGSAPAAREPPESPEKGGAERALPKKEGSFTARTVRGWVEHERTRGRARARAAHFEAIGQMTTLQVRGRPPMIT